MYMGDGSDYESHSITGLGHTNGQVHHVAYVRNGANGYAYLDGVLAGTKTDWSLSTTCTLMPGGESYRTPNLSYGADFCGWNRSLSAQEIRQLASLRPDLNGAIRSTVPMMPPVSVGGATSGVNRIIGSGICV